MRTTRIVVPGAMYHITSRANHKERYLQSAVAKDLFIEQLARMREKNDCRIIDFMVMNNHMHLVLQPLKDSSLSGCMKWLLGVYTMNYNRIFKTWGSVWRGQYYHRCCRNDSIGAPPAWLSMVAPSHRRICLGV